MVHGVYVIRNLTDDDVDCAAYSIAKTSPTIFVTLLKIQWCVEY